jgi:hypothetical protein
VASRLRFVDGRIARRKTKSLRSRRAIGSPEALMRVVVQAQTFILVTLHVNYGKQAAERIPELKAIADWLAAWAEREFVGTTMSSSTPLRGRRWRPS